jgi:hypothetical protein
MMQTLFNLARKGIWFAYNLYNDSFIFGTGYGKKKGICKCQNVLR